MNLFCSRLQLWAVVCCECGEETLNQRPDSEIKRVKTSRNQISTKHHTFHKISQTYKHIIILHFFLRWKRFRSVSGFGDLTRTLTKMTATAFARLVTDLGPEKMRNKHSQHQTSPTKPPFNRGIGLITNHPHHFTKCSLYQCSLMFMPELTSERHICLWKTWPWCFGHEVLRLKQPETFQGRFDVGQVQVSYKLFHWTIGHVSVVFAVTVTVIFWGCALLLF
jgi:hypothetical protein